MATLHDADLILKLYELRREPEMRKARKFVFEFWPRTWDDFFAKVGVFGSDENAWFRQVCGYWDMAASFVRRGALDTDLFYDSGGEMWMVYAKLKPFLEHGRKEFNNPEFLANVEAVVLGSENGRMRLARLEDRIQILMELAAKKQTT